jgi:hypothetical protein
VLDRDNHRDRFSMKKALRSSARGASFHTKHASNANVDRVVLLDGNSGGKFFVVGRIHVVF